MQRSYDSSSKHQANISANKQGSTDNECHTHGGNIYKNARELGISEKSLIDFSASINPLGISDKVKNVMRDEFENLVNYPDPDTTLLRQEIAKHLDIDPETVLCGNGSTELIYLLPRALRPKKVLIPSPTFSEYERACGLHDTLEISHYALQEAHNFKIIPDDFCTAMKGHDMAFLCNPNNPTGHLLRREDVLSISDAARDMNCYLVLDEAFIDFIPEESAINLVQDNPFLIVLRSMTKFYGITGLRIGYAVFHEKVLRKVIKYKEPWTVNTLAQKAAISALKDIGYVNETMELIKQEKIFLESGFREMGLDFFPSAANYYLLNISDARDACIKMRKKGVLVRDCSNFSGLGGSYIRVAVKSHHDNKILLDLISELWKQ